VVKPQAPLAPTISTRAELDARLAAREIPHCEIHFTPMGSESVEVRRSVNALAENRIKFLESRLSCIKQGFANDHAKALAKGKAKGDFDREKI
jgi:hypothetical protein